MDRLAHSDLIYVSWALTPDDEGMVVVHHAEEGGQVGTKRYDLSEDGAWGKLPASVCQILEEEDRRRGEWTA